MHLLHIIAGGLNEVMSVIRHLRIPLQIPTPASPSSRSSCAAVISPLQVQQLEGNQPTCGPHPNLVQGVRCLPWVFPLDAEKGELRDTAQGPHMHSPETWGR